MSFRKDHLRYFVTVAEEGQITRAARRLAVAQPALSQAIAQLETELGLKLLERHTRGVKLTAEGEAFLAKARAVVDHERDVRLTAQSLARAAKSILEVGFVGPPPLMTSPELFGAFAAAHPEVEVSFRDLPFPCGTTRSWLEPVDVAICHCPQVEPGVRIQALRSEPRAIVVPESHRLAGSEQASATETLGERFIGYDPSVQPAWAAFHSLDDVRGGPPEDPTEDEVGTSMQMLSLLGGRRGVTAVPYCDARIVAQVLRGTAAVKLADAAPAAISLVWLAERENAIVAALAQVALERSSARADG
jgi:DNA-binding transcriptional LysR family regulator